MRLPATARLAEADAATCSADSCLVVGHDGGALAVWRVHGSTATREAVPLVPLPDKVALVAPVAVGGYDLLVLPGRLLRHTSSGWSTVASPPGTPVAAATTGPTLVVATQDASGHTQLWSAQP
jgi:hypothetical protein